MLNYLSGKAKRKVMSVLAASALLAPVALSAPGFDAQAAQVKDVEVTYDVSDIAFSLGANETERTFNWYTEKTDEAGVVQFAKANNGYGQKFPKGKTVTVDATLEEATSGQSSHEATISGLKRNTTYNYRFGDGEGNWSQTYTFTVRGDDEFNFLFFGDAQLGSKGNGDLAGDQAAWNRTLDLALDAFPKTSFLVSAGDQVNKKDSEEEYDAYFSPEELKEYAITTTVGNHDNSPTYSSHFNVPNESELGAINGNGDYYYTYNDALFMVINSNNRDHEGHQQFIEETVAANPDVNWKFVVMHHSIYSENSHKYDGDVLERREELVPVFDENDIDVVFMGHDHGYVRTHQMEANQPLLEQNFIDENTVVDPSGVLYLTANSSSGSKYYNKKDEAAFYTVVRSQNYNPSYSNVEVSDDTFKITTYDVVTGEIIDEYKIVK
ncbi:fibronectin type III domain-containing protein [Ureibacillus composti]